MTKRKFLAVATLAALVGTGATAFSLRSALAEGDWLPVTLVFQTDVKGKIEPCG